MLVYRDCKAEPATRTVRSGLAAVRKPARLLAGLLAAIWLVACSDTTGPNRPPERKGSITISELMPGMSFTGDVADVFSDPDGDRLTYAAESTHPGRVTASMSASELTVSAVSGGDATVTVTATDPGGLFAALSIQVSVLLPNRAPVAVGSIPPVNVDEERPVDLDMIWFFRDPDGDRLEYSAVSRDAGVVAAEVFGSLVRLSALASGVTNVTVTATDPRGLSADQVVQVLATAGPPGFRDDFDSEELGGWQIVRASTEVTDGVLRLTNTTTGEPGQAARQRSRNLSNWQVDIRLGRTHLDGVVRVVFHNAMLDIPTVAAEFGSGVSFDGQETNFRFLILPRGAPGWQPVFIANSDLIADSVGAFTDIKIAFRQLRISVAVGSDTIYFENLGAQGAPSELGILTGLELWSVPLDNANERTALFDWIEVTGTPVAGRPGATDRSSVRYPIARGDSRAPGGINPAPVSAATRLRPAAAPRIRSGRWPLQGSRD